MISGLEAIGPQVSGNWFKNVLFSTSDIVKCKDTLEQSFILLFCFKLMLIKIENVCGKACVGSKTFNGKESPSELCVEFEERTHRSFGDVCKENGGKLTFYWDGFATRICTC